MTKEPTNRTNVKNFSAKSMAVTIATFLLFAAVLTFAVYEGTKNTVTFTANGEELEVRTHADTFGEFLTEQEVSVGEHDYLSQSTETAITEDTAVEWEAAKEYAFAVDGEAATAWTTDNTVSAILAKAGIQVTEHDKVVPALEEKVDEDTTIEIEKAYEVTILNGLEEKKVWSTSTTVADLLKHHKIELGELDRVEMAMDEEVKPDAKIQVVRVEKVTDVVEDSMKFASETKKDDSLLKGKEKLVQKGENGVISKTYEVIKENGKEVKRNLKEEKVVKQPKKQITAVGTKTIVASVSRSNASSSKATTAATQASTAASTAAAPSSGGKEFYVSATAYTASCAGCSGITATGINLKANPGLKVIAVDPRVIPLGTKVWVEGYGNAIAGDTGGAIKGNKIDIFVPNRSDALAFGRKQVKIKILN